MNKKLEEEIDRKYFFSSPWQYGSVDYEYDADVNPTTSVAANSTSSYTRKKLQDECWQKAQDSPYLNTSIRGLQGRLTGYGFETTSDIYEIQEAIDETENDLRNRLYTYWAKFVVRSEIEGELFLCFNYS
jgi:hypothetical protein